MTEKKKIGPKAVRRDKEQKKDVIFFQLKKTKKIPKQNRHVHKRDTHYIHRMYERYVSYKKARVEYGDMRQAQHTRTYVSKNGKKHRAQRRESKRTSEREKGRGRRGGGVSEGGGGGDARDEAHTHGSGQQQRETERRGREDVEYGARRRRQGRSVVEPTNGVSTNPTACPPVAF